MGLPAMPGAEGVSLEPLISGRSRDLGLKAYGEAHQLRTPFGLPVLRFVEDGRWVYIHKVGPELYDSTRDPDELVNLASQHPETVERLRSQLAERLRPAPSHCSARPSPATSTRWRLLTPPAASSSRQ